jgi:hypothetical protein
MAFDILANPELAEAMARHRDDPIGTLGDEVVLCKALLEVAARKGNYGLVATLLAVQSRLSSSHVSNAVRCAQLVEMKNLQAVSQRIARALVARLGSCPEYARAVDMVCEDIATIMADARNGISTVDAESHEVAVPAIENSAHPAHTLARSE